MFPEETKKMIHIRAKRVASPHEKSALVRQTLTRLGLVEFPALEWLHSNYDGPFESTAWPERYLEPVLSGGRGLEMCHKYYLDFLGEKTSRFVCISSHASDIGAFFVDSFNGNIINSYSDSKEWIEASRSGIVVKSKIIEIWENSYEFIKEFYRPFPDVSDLREEVATWERKGRFDR